MRERARRVRESKEGKGRSEFIHRGGIATKVLK